MLIENAYAETGIPDLTQIPQQLAEKTGLPVFACGLIVSAVCIMISVIVTGMLAGKAKNTWIVETIICFSLSSVFIAIGWLPIWMLIVICLIVAFAFFENFSKAIFGDKKNI